MKIYLFFLLILCSLLVNAQIDTNENNKGTEIQEIIISGYKKSDKLTPDLQQLTDKIMSEMPSITLIKRGNYAQEATIRGLNAGQINTTIDNMHIFGACTDRMDPASSYVEPNNLKSIQLNLGPNDEQNSSQIGGGLNFKLSKAELNAEKHWSGKFGGGFESNALAFQTLASLQYSRKKWAIIANGIFRKAQNYHAAKQKEISFSQYEKFNFGVNSIYEINQYNRISVDYLQDNGTNIGYPALTMDVAFANAKIAAITHQYKQVCHKVYQWETKLYYNNIDHAMDDTKRPPETVAMHMDMPGTSQTFGYFTDGSIKIGNKHFFSVKASGYLNDLHAEMTMYPKVGKPMFMLTIPDARRMVNGINLSDKYLITQTTDLLFGIRLEHVLSTITTKLGRQTITSFYQGEPTKNHFVYNAYIQFNQKIKEKSSIYGGVARAIRNPTLQEMYGFYLYNRMDAHDYLGNPDLKPEASLNANLGYKFKQEKFNFDVQSYAYFFSNYITGSKLPNYSVMTIGGAGVKQYVNISKALIYGAELSINWKIIKNLDFKSTNSISIGTDADLDALPFIPPFKSFNQLTYNLRGYRIKTEYAAAAKQNLVSTAKYGETKTPEFHLMNTGVSKRFTIKKTYLNVSLNVENIFDRAYYEHLDVMKVLRSGRNFITHITFEF